MEGLCTAEYRLDAFCDGWFQVALAIKHGCLGALSIPVDFVVEAPHIDTHAAGVVGQASIKNKGKVSSLLSVLAIIIGDV